MGWRVHAFERFHAFEKGVHIFEKGVHFYENIIIFMLLGGFEKGFTFWKGGFTFMKNTK